MGKRLYGLLILLEILMLATGVVADEDKGNLVKNSGFEIDEDNNGIPDSWASYIGDLQVSDKIKEYKADADKDEVVMAIDKEMTYKGNRSVKTQSAESATVCWAQKIPVKGNTMYMFSLHCMSKELTRYGEGAAVQFIFNRGGFQYIDLTMLTGITDWIRVAKLIKVPAEATEMTLAIYGLFNGAGTSWFDEVEFISVAEEE